MSVDWTEVKLGEISQMQYGYTATANKEEVGPKLLRITDIVPDIIDWANVPYCKISDNNYDKYKLQKGDIVIARTGATAGFAKLIRHNNNSVFASYLIRLQLKENCHPEFLGRLIESNIFKSFVNKVKGGAAQPQANAPLLKEFSFNLPPLNAQRKIAGVLSAYDDLIENNTRRIAILEEMAQRIYKEWFVEFKYPGHENDELVDSELGMIPEGWEARKLNELSNNFDRKRVPLSSMVRKDMKGKYPYYGAAKIFDFINDYIFDGCYLLMAEDGSVINNHGGPVLQLVNEKFWVNNHAHVLQGIFPISTEFLSLALSNVPIQGYITGAAQPKISQTNMNRIPLINAPVIILNKFNKIIESIFSSKFILSKKNKTLRQTRDLLLPKLISGKVDVSELNINFGES
jgi:type I restriction enzyme S subunit